MRIVTDSGTDLWLSSEQADELNIHIVPLIVTLEGKSYREGVDIQPAEFYRLLAATDSLPITSQPSAGEFAEVYRRLAVTDPDILSIHNDFRSERHVQRGPGRSGDGTGGEHHPR